MAVIRINKTQNYTVMSNRHFYERDMSLKAKGLLSLMLSLPDNWEYSIEGLASLSKDGKDGVRSALKELEHFGYMTRKRARNNRGILEGTIYTIFEEPQGAKIEKPTLEKPTLEKPTLEKPTLEKPTLENPTLLNTKELNTKELNNNRLNTKGETDKQNTDPNEVVKLYKNICISLPLIKRVTQKRKEEISKLLSIYTLEEIKEAFTKANASDLLNGKKDGRKVGIDWLLKEDNITKLLEGSYDNASKPKGRIEQIPKWMHKEQRQYDYEELEASILANGSSPIKRTVANDPALQARADNLKKSLVGG